MDFFAVGGQNRAIPKYRVIGGLGRNEKQVFPKKMVFKPENLYGKQNTVGLRREAITPFPYPVSPYTIMYIMEIIFVSLSWL